MASRPGGCRLKLRVTRALALAAAALSALGVEWWLARSLLVVSLLTGAVCCAVGRGGVGAAWVALGCAMLGWGRLGEG